MEKIVALIRTHLALGKRELIRGRGALPLHFVLSISPVIAGTMVSQNHVIVIALFALANYVSFGLIPKKIRPRFSLYQIKPYPISNPTILNFLWSVELIDYSFFYLSVPSIACVVILYPDLNDMIYFTTFISAIYVSLSLVLVEIKLLSLYYPSINGILNAFNVIGYVALFGLIKNSTQWDFKPIYELATYWRFEILFISGFLLVLLYSAGIFFLSKLAK